MRTKRRTRRGGLGRARAGRGARLVNEEEKPERRNEKKGEKRRGAEDRAMYGMGRGRLAF